MWFPSGSQEINDECNEDGPTKEIRGFMGVSTEGAGTAAQHVVSCAQDSVLACHVD